MFLRKKDKKNKAGFTIIEALVFLFIFVVSVSSFYAAFSAGTVYILESKNRMAATHVANEKMEIIRSLVYDNIGTKKPNGSGGWIYGIPSGDILEYDTISKNTRTFYVHTLVKYEDDPFDGTATGSPSDIRPADYKEVRVQVSWDSAYSSVKSVYLVSRFVPPGVESESSGGILSVNIQDNTGAPINGVSVRLENSVTGVDQTHQTVEGNAMFFEVPEDLTPNYRITVSGGGLFSVRTYPAYDSSDPDSFDPVDRDTPITAGTLWQVVITTDKESELEIATEDPFGAVVPDVVFSFEGGRKKGNEDPLANPLVPVYSYDQAGLDTGSDGRLVITDVDGISSGSYVFRPESILGYRFIKMENSTVNAEEFYLQPDADVLEKAIFANENLDSLLATVVDDVTGDPIEGASVTLRNSSLGYDHSVDSDKLGIVYFPDSVTALSAQQYEVVVTAAGYVDINDTVDIDKLVTKEFRMSL